MSAVRVTRLRHLVDIWRECVRRFPSKTAVIADDATRSYQWLEARIGALAGGLAEHYGIGKGERVVLLMRNSPAFFMAYWAALRLGAVVAAVNTRLSKAEAEGIIRLADGRLLIHDAGLKELAAGAPAKDLLDDQALPALAEAGRGAPPPPKLSGDDLAVLAHTSGTTGEPKMTEVTHGNLLFNLRIAILAHSLRHEDVILVGVPMFHCTPLYSLLPSAAYLGATLVITAETNPTRLAEAARRTGATVWFGVPTLFHQLAVSQTVADDALAGVRLLAYAGSPMRPQTIRRLRQRWPHLALHNFFGLTETISMTHVLPSRDADTHADSIGKLLPEVFARIVDSRGRDAPAGRVGELVFHRRNVVRAYWRRPGLIEQSFTGDWFRTGDLASVDADGYFYIRGRLKDMIITAGENVFAGEVESVLARHPQIQDVAVVGVPATGVRASLGELVKAVIVPAPGVKLADAEVKRFVAQHLASYKVPQLVEFRAELPRTATGKVIKEQLRGGGETV